MMIEEDVNIHQFVEILLILNARFNDDLFEVRNINIGKNEGNSMNVNDVDTRTTSFQPISQIIVSLVFKGNL